MSSQDGPASAAPPPPAVIDTTQDGCARLAAAGIDYIGNTTILNDLLELTVILRPSAEFGAAPGRILSIPSRSRLPPVEEGAAGGGSLYAVC